MTSRVTVGELVLDPFQVVFSNFRTFLATQGPFLVLAAVIGLVGAFVATPDAAFDPAAPPQDPGDLFREVAPAAAASSLTGVVQFLAQVLALGVGLVVARGVLAGESLTLGDAWARFRPRAGAVVLTVLVLVAFFIGIALAGVMLFFLILPLLAIPFVWLWVLSVWGLAPAAAALDDARVSESLRRSQDVTRGNRGTLYGSFLLFALAYVVVSTLVVGPVALAGMDWDALLDPAAAPAAAVTPSPVMIALTAMLGLVVDLVFWPALAVMLATAYRKLKDAADVPDVPPPYPGAEERPPGAW